MIKMTALSGPHAGKIREVVPGIDPGVIWEFMSRGWDWRIDYSKATPEEEFEWFRIDIMARIVRALRGRLPVEFNGKHYLLEDDSPETLERVGQEVEDAISSSDTLITLEYDDERGVKIATVGRVM